jgi:hypothetical protein
MNLINKRIKESRRFYSLLNNKHNILSEEIIIETSYRTKIKVKLQTNINKYNILANLVKKLLKIDIMKVNITLLVDEISNKIYYVIYPDDKLFTVKGTMLLNSKGDILLNETNFVGSLQKYMGSKIEKSVEETITNDIGEIIGFIMKMKS